MTTTRHRPGIAFTVRPAPAGETLPRMDVAAFVGVASMGPLHTPVPVDDLGRFRDLFGPDPRLAWDAARGRFQYANLGSTVEAFFANGGRRCWVVRVADAQTARVGRFPLPGLFATPEGGGSSPGQNLTQAVARARAHGSWCDPLRAGTVLVPTTLPLSDPPDLSLVASPGAYRVDVLVDVMATAVRPWDLLKISCNPEITLFFFVERITRQADGLRLEGSTGRWFSHPPASPPGDGRPQERIYQPVTDIEELTRHASPWATGSPPPEVAVERLRFDLLVWRDEALVSRFADLAFHTRHPRFWGHLPTDQDLFALPQGRLTRLIPAETAALRTAADAPRFALAGPDDKAPFHLPLHMPERPDPALAEAPQETSGSPLERDGLVPFEAHLFVDPELRFTNFETVLREAEHRHSLHDCSLRGIHSLLPVSEISLVAVPDAAHPGWTKEPAPLPEPLETPEPSGAVLPHSDFTSCTPQETTAPPSNTMPSAPVVAQRAWTLQTEGGGPLLDVHRALLRFCAARGDLLAVLSLPRAHRAEQAAHHLEALARKSSEETGFVAPLSSGEGKVLQFGAMYHPWIATVPEQRRPRSDLDHDLDRGATGLAFTPPDGAVCGQLAKSSRRRGAWVAAANRPLAGAVALEPDTDVEGLIAAGINAIHRDPRGFLALAADTLSTTLATRPIPVRRLLMLLRRLALREGSRDVFEPDDADFRARVRHRFERLLSALYLRGALAGKSADEAFRVVVDDSINPRENRDHGRFIVELRVAPALPLSFLTVRLVHTGPAQWTLEEP